MSKKQKPTRVITTKTAPEKTGLGETIPVETTTNKVASLKTTQTKTAPDKTSATKTVPVTAGPVKTAPENLPKLPGVYLFKNKNNQIIYVGKAKVIQKRVASYFQKHTDWKVTALIKEHTSIEHIVTYDEMEALLLEAQLIRDNKPKYNVLLTTGNPFVYVLLTTKEPLASFEKTMASASKTKRSGIPTLKIVRTKKEKGRYFGPFLRKHDARMAYHALMRMFSLYLCEKDIPQGCLDYHLQKCAGTCREKFNIQEYLDRLTQAVLALEENYDTLLEHLTKQLKNAIQHKEFEKARNLHQTITHFDSFIATLKTGFHENKYDPEIVAVMAEAKPKQYATREAAEQLQQILGLSKPPQILDCFDISHFQSTALVGSCVRFIDGVAEKNKFRRFKIKSIIEQNDYAALQEIVQRRYRDGQDLPDLIVIDGGKGQLSAVLPYVYNTPCIALAKREETIFTSKSPAGIKLDLHTQMGKLLIALRDYTHHFALRYHQTLRRNERVPGIPSKKRTQA